jgi:hypothetical protein
MERRLHVLRLAHSQVDTIVHSIPTVSRCLVSPGRKPGFRSESPRNKPNITSNVYPNGSPCPFQGDAS